MEPSELSHLRLANQQISKTQFQNVQELVRWMGALQAQHYKMVKWAIGLRVSNSTKKQVQEAIDKGTIIRTHLLRPTWHLVSAKDLHWMTQLTAPFIKKTLSSRHRTLEFTDEIIKKCYNIFENALAGGNFLSRSELVDKLDQANIDTSQNRSSHILLLAELDGVVCSGPDRGKKYTYALLNERVPHKESIPRDEALARLAQTYFRSHGPATLEDFCWWSGLSVTDSRAALAMIKNELDSENIEDNTYWFIPLNIPNAIDTTTHLLPAYDEFLISYKSRHISLDPEHHNKTFSSNGIFWPTIVSKGRVIGTWKRALRKNKVTIETDFFADSGARTTDLEEAAKKFGCFWNKQAEIEL